MAAFKKRTIVCFHVALDVTSFLHACFSIKMSRRICVKYGSNPQRKKVIVLDESDSDLAVLRKACLKILKSDEKCLLNLGGSRITVETDLIFFINDPSFGEIEMEADSILSNLETVIMKLQIMDTEGINIITYNELLLYANSFPLYYSCR